MRKFLFLLGILATVTVFGQGKTLYGVSMVKPKIGQATAFESAWKMHVAKFHNNDNKRTIYEILSGPHTGCYFLVDGPSAFADMDKERGDKTAHDKDFETTCASKLEMDGGVYTYRWVDTLSYKGDVQSDKYLITVTHVKNGKMPGFMTEMRKGALLAMKTNPPVSYNSYVQLMAGSDPVLVSIRNLKDGFKELEDGYNGMKSTDFKEAYVKEYGQADWDKRQAIVTDDIQGREVYMMKLRKDLSSK